MDIFIQCENDTTAAFPHENLEWKTMHSSCGEDLMYAELPKGIQPKKTCVNMTSQLSPESSPKDSTEIPTAETPLNEIIDWDTCAQISKWAGGIGFLVLDEIKKENKSDSKSEEDFVICKPKKSLSKPNSLEDNHLESKILETSKKGFRDPCWERKRTNIKNNIESEDLFECFSDPIVLKHLKDIVSGAADGDWFPRLFRVVKFIYQKESPNCIPNSIVELFQPLEEFKKLCDVTSKESIIVSWTYSRKSCSKNIECCFPILWISPSLSFEDGYAGIGWEYFSVNVKIWCDKYAKSKNKILKHESKDKISESFLRYFATMKKPQD